MLLHHLRLHLVLNGIVQVVEEVQADEGLQGIHGHRGGFEVLVFGDVLHQEADGGVGAVSSYAPTWA